MSATQCLKHEWLNDLPAKASKSKVCLKSQLLLQKYMAQRKWKVSFFLLFFLVKAAFVFLTCPLKELWPSSYLHFDSKYIKGKKIVSHVKMLARVKKRYRRKNDYPKSAI